MMKGSLKKTLTGAILAGLGASYASVTAAEFLDFQIDEGSVPGVTSTLGSVITADKINGGYDELLTINPDFSFTSTAVADFTALFADEGTPPAVVSFLNATYKMYAIFDSAGLYDVTMNKFTGATGEFNLYIDPNADTTYGFNDLTNAAAGSSVTGGGADDYLIATAMNAVKLAGIPGTPGAFDFIWNDFTLTAAGSTYFISPDPFYLTVRVNGDFDEDTFAPGTTRQSGDLSAVFIPEPATLALLGLGMIGAGAARRRNRS